MNQSEQIQSYVIVGGGTAGWISAAILARAYQNLNVSIEVIESPTVPTIGVGEATVPAILHMLEFLKIPLQDFIQKTNATFKLAIKFTDWLKPGHHYWHPFGVAGNKIDGKPFFQHWLKHHLKGGQFNFTDFSPSVALAKQNKFFVPDPKQPTNLSSSAYALHFDAGLVAEYLANYCKQLGVKHTKANVTQAELNQYGDISHLKLDDSSSRKADFFIDCSGQQGLLISKTLKVGFENWQHYLPVDSAVAVQSDVLDRLPPYTESTAEQSGWRWQIPLRNRTGNGYVFCSDFCDSNAAFNTLRERVPNWTTEPKTLRFVTGKRNKVWYRNCLAIGLSSGFLEPLESTSIYLISKVMFKFIQSVPTKTPHDPTVSQFNEEVDQEYRHIRDFIVLHYHASQRSDSDFWRMWQTLAIPESLQQKLDLYRQQGRIFQNSDDIFLSESWYAVLTGMNILPKYYDPLIDASVFAKIEAAFSHSFAALNASASKTADHNLFIQAMQNKR